MNYKPFRFWCQKVLPLVYDDSLSYYEVLCKIVKYLNNLIDDTKNISAEVEELRQIIQNLNSGQLFQIVEAVIEEMKKDGSFDEAIQQALLKEVVDYNFEQPTLFADSTRLSEYFAALDAQGGASEWCTVYEGPETLGGNHIRYYRIGKPDENGHIFRSGLIFADMDAREYQGTYMLANAVKTILYNLDNSTGASVHGVSLEKLFTGYYLFVMPTANPDGYRLCVEGFYDDLPQATQQQLQTMMERFIRGQYFDDSDFTTAEQAELLTYCGGDYANYNFRKEDIPKCWHGNLAGIDPHYNSYNNDMISRLQAYSSLNHWPDFPAPRNYVNAGYDLGFSCVENQIVKQIMDNNGVSSILDYHQRGPTMFYQYRYGGRQQERNNYISQRISDATQTPVSQGNSDKIGFVGWFYQIRSGEPTHYAAIKEVGWSNTHVLVNGASDPLNPNGFMINPMPRQYQSRVYINEFPGILEFMYQAVCNMNINRYFNKLSRFDLASSVPTGISKEETVIDQAYLEGHAFLKYELASTDQSLMQMFGYYVAGSIVSITVLDSGSNVPNILLPGAYPNGRILFIKGGNFAYCLFFGNNGDTWSCEISANTSTTWRLTSNVSGYILIPAGESRTVTTPYDGYLVFSCIGGQVSDILLGRSVTNETSTFTLTNNGSGSTTVFYIVAGKNYNSRQV